jgi:hypothetical protein
MEHAELPNEGELNQDPPDDEHAHDDRRGIGTPITLGGEPGQHSAGHRHEGRQRQATEHRTVPR